ncbi:uncharacterized protein LOC142977280 [Anticarsia gemmatalis]|uniref:uncharacterized protein LOC142977280 n=1 Tax=Anticarsia gemmatalis TaxID=129554 RepID=UPI003F75A725
MSKFTCLFVCVVAVTLSGVYAVSEEEKAAFREAVLPLVGECSTAHGVSQEDIKSAKEAGNPEGINSCFIGCVFKKLGVLTPQGEYDVDASLEKLRKFVKSDEDFNKFADVGKICVSVNDKPVSDGEAGCDKAKLLLSCFLEHKAEIPL